MSIENLIKAAPPPAAPFEAYDGPWETIEAELGVPLPPDYKDFARIYGSGYFMEFMGVYLPRSSLRHMRLDWNLRFCWGIFCDDEDLPYAIWPAPGGLIAFGSADNGEFLFWLPRGDPADWPVVVWDRGFGTFEVLECDLTDFLAGLATGEVAPEAFPDDLLPCEVLFQPRSDDRSADQAGVEDGGGYWSAPGIWRLRTRWTTGYVGGQSSGDGVLIWSGRRAGGAPSARQAD